MSKVEPIETEIESITYTPIPTEEPAETPTVTEEPMETPTVTEEPMETPTVTEEPMETPTVAEEPMETLAVTSTAVPIVQIQGVDDVLNIGLFVIFFIGLLCGLVSAGIMWRRLRT